MKTATVRIKGADFGQRFTGATALLLERLLTWQERAAMRRRLAELDRHMLKDIGLSRSQIDAEVRKPFWQA